MIFWKGEKFSLGGLILIIKNTIIIKENTNYVTSFYFSRQKVIWKYHRSDMKIFEKNAKINFALMHVLIFL